MKILVVALYVSGDVREGGSSFFMKCIIDNLKEMGHSVTAASKPGNVGNAHFYEAIKQRYDLIVCSHREILSELGNNDAPKICISQGLVGPETFIRGADFYYSISEEARLNNRDKFGIDSQVIPQPLNIPRRVKPVNSSLKNILVVRRYPVDGCDPFEVLKGKYNVRISDKSKPIAPQMEWADMCVTLGRGALEAMALGRTVLVADKRHYMGKALGDGYVNSQNIFEIEKNNFSGRRNRCDITPDWLLSEVAKYNSEDANFLRDYVKSKCDAQQILCKLIKDAYPALKYRNVELSSFHDYIIHKIPHGSKVLELGSGPGTIRLSDYFSMQSIEHNKEWVGYAPLSNYIYAPIANGWYKRENLASIEEGYSVLLVDGPTGTIGRQKFLENLDLFDLGVTIVFDDVNRPAEMEVFKSLLSKLPGRDSKVFKGPLKDYAVIAREGCTLV